MPKIDMEQHETGLKFILIPREVLFDHGLNCIDAVVFGILNWACSMYSRKCTMSNKTIGGFVGVKERRVRYALARLSKSGHIQIRYKDPQKRNRESISLASNDHRNAEGRHQEDIAMAPDGSRDSTSVPQSINKKNKNTLDFSGPAGDPATAVDKAAPDAIPQDDPKWIKGARHRKIRTFDGLLQLQEMDKLWLVKKTGASFEQIETAALQAQKWLINPEKTKRYKTFDGLMFLHTWIKRAQKKGWLKPTRPDSSPLPLDAGEWDNGNGTWTIVEGEGKDRTEFTLLDSDYDKRCEEKSNRDLLAFVAATADNKESV